MHDSSYRLNFDLGKKNEIYHHSWKEHLKISKSLVTKCCKSEDNIAVRSLQILYTFVLRAEVLTTFGSKVVIFSGRVIQKHTKLANFALLYFPHFTIFRDQTL